MYFCFFTEQALLAENASFRDAVDEFEMYFVAIEVVGLAVDVIKKLLDVLDGRPWLASRASSGFAVLLQ